MRWKRTLQVWARRTPRAYVTGTLTFRPGTRGSASLPRTAPGSSGFACPANTAKRTDSCRLLVNVIAPRRSECGSSRAKAGRCPTAVARGRARDTGVSRRKWGGRSSESGRSEMSVRSARDHQRVRFPVKRRSPVWRRDNSELFFVDPRGQLRSVTVMVVRDSQAWNAVKMDFRRLAADIGAPRTTSRQTAPDLFPRRNEDTSHEIHVVSVA